MKLQDLLKDIELGKVYTDKDRKPFKVHETKCDCNCHQDKMNEAGSMGYTDFSRFTDNPSDYTAPKRDTSGGMKVFYQKYSSPEAKSIVDGSLRKWAKELRKYQYKIIKDWMTAAKAGQIDFFDLIRGFKTGDVSRAKPFETKFLASLLTQDKIIDRFRSYFNGKKGKKR